MNEMILRYSPGNDRKVFTHADAMSKRYIRASTRGSRPSILPFMFNGAMLDATSRSTPGTGLDSSTV